jgi:hypothetical protein
VGRGADFYNRWFVWAYDNEDWKKISVRNRRHIMKVHLDNKPDACPFCGGPDPCLYNVDGKYRKVDLQWYWSCRKCEGLAARRKNRNPPHIHIKKE